MKRIISILAVLSILAVFSILVSFADPRLGGPEPVKAAPDADSPPCDSSDPTLVGCWLFSERSGTTAVDGSSYVNNGTLVSATMWITDRFGTAGKALHFDGSAQYVKVQVYVTHVKVKVEYHGEVAQVGGL